MTKTLDVLDSAKKIREIGQHARNVFIDREDTIHALECGLCSGEHMVMMGQPGTSKSALARFFSESMGLNFFRVVANPDMVREDLFGPISGKALAEDRWERRWSALATADIALVDEIGKASPQVLNMMLDAMEERLARSADVEIKIPLHMLVAGTNETLDEELAAIWDRFTIRTIVRYLKRTADFVNLLTVNVDDRVSVPVNREELANLRNTATVMSVNLEDDVKNCLIEMWSEAPNKITTPVSDRRWKKLLRVAAGRALLHYRNKIHVEDLIVGKWILWDDIDDEPTVHEWVTEKVSRDQREYMDTLALVKELEDRQLTNLMPGQKPTAAEMGDMLYRAHKIIRMIGKYPYPDERWIKLRDRAQNLINTFGE